MLKDQGLCELDLCQKCEQNVVEEPLDMQGYNFEHHWSSGDAYFRECSYGWPVCGTITCCSIHSRALLPGLQVYMGKCWEMACGAMHGVQYVLQIVSPYDQDGTLMG